MNRNESIDVSRAAAIIMIVSCHYLMFTGAGLLGRFFANIGNFIFFAISAILFGLRYESKGASAFVPKPFLIKRLVRLFASLWPFLIAVLTIYTCIGVEYSPLRAAMNFVGLSWFAKLPNIGHLWFVTMIILCYIMYVVCAKIQIISKLNWLYGGGILLVISMILECYVDYIGLPGYLFMVLFYSLWFFGNAGRFINWVKTIPTLWLWLGFMVCNTAALALCYHCGFTLGISAQRFACYLSGLSWLVVFLRYGTHAKPYGWLMFLSGTSYEIYLVHHVLCQGELSIIHTTDYAIVNYMTLWGVSICLGWGLKQIGDRLNRIIIK